MDDAPVGCPGCGRDLEVVWRVRFGDSAGFVPVFPPGTTQDSAECRSCGATFRRTDGGPWRRDRRGSGEG